MYLSFNTFTKLTGALRFNLCEFDEINTETMDHMSNLFPCIDFRYSRCVSEKSENNNIVIKWKPKLMEQYDNETNPLCQDNNKTKPNHNRNDCCLLS